MSNYRESLENRIEESKKRLDPKGILKSVGVSVMGIAPIVGIESAVTYGINELYRDLDPRVVNLLIAGTLAFANISSITLEAMALRRKNYSSSPLATFINIGTGRPSISAIADHAIGNAAYAILSPAALYAQMNNDPNVFLEGAAATSLTITLWSAPINAAIATDLGSKLRRSRRIVADGAVGK